MHRLEVRCAGTEVGARCQAQAAHHAGAEVGKDVAEHVLGHHHTKAFGTPDHPQGYGIDVVDVGRDCGILLRHLVENVFGKGAAVAQHVGLVGQGHTFETLLACVFEGEAEQARQAAAGLQAQRHAGILGATAAPGGALALALAQQRLDLARHAGKIEPGIQAFGVLADHGEAKAIFSEYIGHRPDIGEQAQLLAQLNDRRHVIHALAAQVLGQLRLGFAQRLAGDRAQQAGIGGGNLRPGARRYRVTVAAPAFPADVSEVQVNGQLQGVKQRQHGVGHFRADAVTGHHADARAWRAHGRTPGMASSGRAIRLCSCSARKP